MLENGNGKGCGYPLRVHPPRPSHRADELRQLVLGYHLTQPQDSQN